MKSFIIEGVNVRSGKINVDNQSRSLNVVVPAGVSGKDLKAWKERNESAIVAGLQAEDSPESSDPGDSNGQA